MIDLYSEQQDNTSKIKTWFLTTFSFLKDPKSLFYYVLILIGTGFGFYFLMIIQNGFTSPWSGDYTMQYIPFAYNYYDDWMTFFHTGVFPHWDMNIFLGADTITSDGYYIMFSPFFIPLLIFPRSWIPTMLVFISILRMTLAGVFFRLYLKKLGVGEKFARFGGIAYAFCGYTAYFIWFNNFLDIVCLLPAILYGIEVIFKDKKPWILALSLGILGIDNFFFFPCIVIMTFVYSMFRFFQTIKQRDVKNNFFVLGMGFCGYVVGIMIASCVFIPGLVTGMSDPKVEEVSYLKTITDALKLGTFDGFMLAMNYLFNWGAIPSNLGGGIKYQTMPIIELFFPPVTCRHIPLVNAAQGNTFDNNAGSLWVTFPILLFFIPAVIQSFKDKKVSHFIAIAIFILVIFTPFSYFLLFGGGKAYSRWQIIVPACMIAYVVAYLDKHPEVSIKRLVSGLVFVTLGIFTSGLLAYLYVSDTSGKKLEYFLPFPAILFIEFAYILLLFFIFLTHYHKKRIRSIFTYIVCVETVAVGIFVTLGHGATNLETTMGGRENNNNLYHTVKRIKSSEDKENFYRMFTSLNIKQYSDNNQNMNNYNGASFFHTLYNYNTRAFKYWTQISDGYSGWSGSLMEKRVALDHLLGIKYYVLQHDEYKENILDNNLNPNYQINVPFGQEFVEELSDENYYVYKNENISSLGYGVDNVYTYKAEEIKDVFGKYIGHKDTLRNEEFMLHNAVIDEEAYAKFTPEQVSGLNKVETMQTLKQTHYKKLYIQDDADGYEDDLPSYPYSRRYYRLNNYKEFDLNNIGNIPNINDGSVKKLTANEIVNEADTNAGRMFIFIQRKDGQTFEDFNKGISLYIDATYATNTKSDIYLIDENDNIITFDSHSDHNGVHTGWRGMRAFYSDVKVKAIAIHPRYKYLGDYSVYAQSRQTWDDIVNNLQPFTEVKNIDPNSFTFKSNFDKIKVATTNIAFERGWNVFAKGVNDAEYVKLDTFLTNGGFVGFVAPEGEVSYYMSYKNPDFIFASKITLTGCILFGVSYISFIGYEIYRKKDKYYKNPFKR